MVNRTVNIVRQYLIKKLKENKENHIDDYNEAVIAYRQEAAEQLKNLAKSLEDGNLKIELKLVHPINRSEEYDKLIEMFEWETKDEIQLSQNEFNMYVLDELPTIMDARFLNSSYKSKFMNS